MNIFYLSHCPKKAAQVQYNKHVVKMILETAQLLCTAHHELGTSIDIPYKATHKNHPSAIWVRSSAEAYMWAYEHMLALGAEYTKRYGKEHLTIAKCREVLYTLPNGISDDAFAQPPQCMPDQYKTECSVDAYWNYYENEKHTVKNANESIILRNENKRNNYIKSKQ